MRGPGTGRVIGAAAALAACAALAIAVSGLGGLGPTGMTPVVMVPAVVASCLWIVRMALWALVWHPPRPTPADPAVRAAAERALPLTEIAVICDGESMVSARTSVIAAVTALGDPRRVLLVGAEPRLDDLARSLGVRRVSCGAGEWVGAVAAVSAASQRYLVLTSASRVLLPGALRPALEHFQVGGPGVAFVQAEPIAPGDRSVIEHVRHRFLWPSLEARGAMPLLGLDAVVDAELFAQLPVAAGPAAVTVAAQRLGLEGRRVASMLCVEQADRRRDRRAEALARARRLRRAAGLGAPWWARRLRGWQRIGHALVVVEDLVGFAALAGVVAVSAALLDGTSPLTGPSLVAAAVAAGLGGMARVVMTRGLLRPPAMLRAATDDIPVAVASVAMPARRLRAGAGAGAGRGVLLVLTAVVDVALIAHAASLLGRRRPPTAIDAALFVAGTVTMVSLLASARVVRRNRTWRAGRRLPVSIGCSIGSWRGRVLDLGASGLRAEFAAPAELLAVVPLRLDAPGAAATEVRVQVVRVEARGERWELGLRLAGGGAAGAHDDYLALWLSQMAGAAEERPRRVADQSVGRAPVRAGGAPLLRLASAVAMVAVALAVLPAGGPVIATANVPATSTTAPAATTSTAATTMTAAPDSAVPATSVVVSGAAAPPATSTPTAGADSVPDDGPEDGPADGSAGTGVLAVEVSADDEDRVAEGGQVLAYRADLRAAGAGAVSLADVVVSTNLGSIEPDSMGGTCDGAAAGLLDAPVEGSEAGPTTSGRWVLFAGTALEAGATCSLSWSVRLPPATAVADGTAVRATLRVPSLAPEGGDDTTGPTVGHEMRLHRPTLRLRLQAGSSDADRVTVGVPANWVARVENVSPWSTTAHGIDLVLTLPPHWTYTSTVAVEPARCDTAPVVLTDAETSVQTIALTDACDLAAGEELVVTLAATPTEQAVSGPGLITGAGRPAEQVGEVRLTAEDAGGTTLGEAASRAGATLRTVDLVVRLTDAGRDDAAAEQSPALVEGGLARYRIDVANDGPDTSSGGVDVTLDLPAGMVPLQAAGDGWVCVTDVPVTCTHALPIGVSRAAAPIVVSLAVGGLLPEGATSTVVTATATVNGVDADADPDDDVDAETTLVRPQAPADATTGGADLAITAFTAARRVVVGEEVEVEVVVTGQGPLADPGPVRVEGEVTPGLELRSAAGNDWSCDLAPRSRADFSCEIAGPVTDGLPLPVIVLSAVLAPDAVSHLAPSAQRTVEFEATVVGTTAAGRDGATTRLGWEVTPQAELSLGVRTSSDAPAPSQVGVPGEVELVVANAGPNGEYGPVTVEVPAAAGLTVVDAGGTGWACRRVGPDAATLSCTGSRLGAAYGEPAIAAGGASNPLRLVLTASEVGSLRLAASVTGVTDDAVRRATFDLEIVANVSRSLRLETAADEAVAGSATEVTVVLANDGESETSAGAAFTIELPGGWRLAAVDDPAWTCVVTSGAPVAPGAAAGDSAACSRATPLAPGEVENVGVRLAVGADTPSGDVGIAAALTSDPVEVDPIDDVDSVEIWVRGRPAEDAEPTPVGADTAATAVTDAADAADAADATGADGTARTVDAGRLAGFGGSAGALALALVLLSGRRRPGW